MNYSKELEDMCVVKKGVNHGPAPIPEEGKWVKAKEIKIFLALHMVLAGVHTTRSLQTNT